MWACLQCVQPMGILWHLGIPLVTELEHETRDVDNFPVLLYVDFFHFGGVGKTILILEV